jgi:hypothetical protein
MGDFEKYVENLQPSDIISIIDDDDYKHPNYKIDDYYIYIAEPKGDYIKKITCDKEFITISNNYILDPFICMQYSDLCIATKFETEKLCIQYVNVTNDTLRSIGHTDWNNRKKGIISSNVKFLDQVGQFTISSEFPRINIPHYDYTITKIVNLGEPIILRIGTTDVDTILESFDKFPICMKDVLYHHVSLHGTNIKCIIYYEFIPTSKAYETYQIKYEDKIATFEGGLFHLKNI